MGIQPEDVKQEVDKMQGVQMAQISETNEYLAEHSDREEIENIFSDPKKYLELNKKEGESGGVYSAKEIAEDITTRRDFSSLRKESQHKAWRGARKAYAKKHGVSEDEAEDRLNELPWKSDKVGEEDTNLEKANEDALQYAIEGVANYIRRELGDAEGVIAIPRERIEDKLRDDEDDHPGEKFYVLEEDLE